MQDERTDRSDRFERSRYLQQPTEVYVYKDELGYIKIRQTRGEIIYLLPAQAFALVKKLRKILGEPEEDRGKLELLFV